MYTNGLLGRADRVFAPYSPPEGICLAYSFDQLLDLWIKSRSTLSAAFAGPVAAKPLSMPANDGLWFDDVQRVWPLAPQFRYKHPESPIGLRESGSRTLLFQDR